MVETAMPQERCASRSARAFAPEVGGPSRGRRRGRARPELAGGLLAALILCGPHAAHGQRLQTYTGEGRQPILTISGPDAPISDWDAIFDPLQVDIGTNVTLPHDRKFYGVTAIAMQEKGDEGCKVELYGNLLDPTEPSSDILLGTGTLSGCDEHRTMSWRAATLVSQPNTFIRSMRACYQNSPFIEMKMKGLMVSGALLVSTDGQLFSLPEMPCIDKKTPHCFARPHCGNWFETVYCPTGQILTGVTVYHYDDNGKAPRAISAIQPWCKGVRLAGG